MRSPVCCEPVGLIFCEQCQTHSPRPCYAHARITPDKLVIPYSVASLPESLYLHAAVDDDSEKAVFAREIIPALTIFGPLMGSVTSIKPAECAFACGNAENEELRYFQLDSDHTSNWMKHVRFASSPQECNLAVFEMPQSVPFWQPSNGALRLGMVIFVTIRAILPNEELKIAYSWDYATRIRRGCLGNTATGNITRTAANISSGLPADNALTDNHSSSFINFDVSITANGNVLMGLPAILPDRADASSECTDAELVSDFETGNDFLPLVDDCFAEADDMDTGTAFDTEDSALMGRITAASPVDNDGTVSEMPVRHPEKCSDLPLGVNNETDCSEILHASQDNLKTKKHLQSRKKGKCLVCGKQYFNLVFHLSTTHTEEDVRAVDDACFICHRKFKSTTWLARHLKTVHRRISPPDETARLAALDYIRRTGFLHYRCAFCSKTFPNEALLNIHAFAHDADNSRPEEQPERKCPACAFTASTFAELIEHTGQHAASRTSRAQKECILCGVHVADLKKHAQSNHPEVLEILRDKWPYECSECSQIFMNVVGLKCHMNLSHQDRRCLYCGFSSHSMKTFTDHVQQHRVNGRFPCRWCGTSYEEYGLLAAHVRDNHRDGEDQFAEMHTDALCDSQLPDELNADEVGAVHTTSNTNESVELAEFIQHIKETSTFSYFCRSCKLHFPIKALLDLHKIHHYADRKELNQRPERRCPVCDFEGAGFSDLMRHTRDHGLRATDKKPCAVCGEHFQHLKTHFRAQHPDIMKRLEESWHFRCEECGERCKCKTTLNLHIKLAHSGFQCLYCAKLFRNQRDLGLHVRPEHSVNGEFPCPSCDKKFRKYPFIKVHYREHHDVTQMEACDICQHVCRAQNQLAQHMKNVHDVQVKVNKFKRGINRKRPPSYRKTPAGGYECPECGKALKSYLSLYMHKQNVHHFGKNQAEWNKMLLSGEIPQKGARPRLQFTCDECGIVVSSYSCLHRHKRWKHVGDYKEKFEKRRAEKKRLGIYTHWKTYKKPRDRMALEDFPYKCDECQLGFIRGIALEKHNATRHPAGNAQQS
ncbi:zinc finger protein 888-like [Paramacrobiotus metropolitanus]|uniref:zinc finger protein 888-like n=1 Tax=Paramacrobiotus metropolitanus TaxID=2943436 RepID=UPI0024458E73|nr:zinc finger protein 888-like [Paramacrobiotus metropolitanus]